MKLTGKRALVTGAGSDGIGRAIVEAYATEGADVAAHFHDQRMPESVLARIEASGAKIFQIRGNFADPSEARRTVRESAERLGGLDILVANAGITERVPFLELTDVAFDRVIAINLRACFACCQEAARIMIRNGAPGRIIVVTSVNENNVVPLQAHYCASKGGARQLARSMALELAPHGINVNIIAPAATLTDMVRHKHKSDPEWSKQVARNYPLGRIAMPEDFGGVAVFLAGDDCRFVTGISIPVDGGYSLSKSAVRPED